MHPGAGQQPRLAAGPVHRAGPEPAGGAGTAQGQHMAEVAWRAEPTLLGQAPELRHAVGPPIRGWPKWRCLQEAGPTGCEPGQLASQSASGPGGPVGPCGPAG